MLSVSETDLCEHLISKYILHPPILKRQDICIHDHQETNVNVNDYGRRVSVRGTSITIAVPFDGDGDLFGFQPSTYNYNPPCGNIVGQELHLNYNMTDHDADALKKTYERELDSIEKYLQWLHKDIRGYNDGLPQFIQDNVVKRKQKLLADAGMVSSLGIPVRRRPQESLTFVPPEIRRKPTIRRPEVHSGKFQPEPALGEEDYDYILKTTENMVFVMERSPEAFAKMEEEHLRDHILVQLNGHYEGQATGETFNYKGKTDILIRYENKNVFIAECKFWDGPKYFLETINQILGYTSWRDTKTAIIIFNRNQNLSSVIQKISNTVSTHQCFKSDLGKLSETHFRYLFHQPQDKNRELFLAILLFNVPSNIHSN